MKKFLLVLMVMVLLIPLASFTSTDMHPSLPHQFAGHCVQLNNGEIISVSAEIASNADDSLNILNSVCYLMRSTNYGVTWNTESVLFHTGEGYTWSSISFAYDKANNIIYLFYTKYYDEHNAKIYCITSSDNGHTWSTATFVNTGYDYNAFENDGIQTQEGYLMIPFSCDTNPNGNYYWKCGVLINTGSGWSLWGSLIDYPTPQGYGIDEPAIMQRNDGSILCIMRTQFGHLFKSTRTFQTDWTQAIVTNFVSGDTCAFIQKVSYTPNVSIICWNNHSTNRYPLVIAKSYDDLETIGEPLELATGHNVCYPVGSMLSNGNILITAWDNPSPNVDNYISWLISLSEIPAPTGTPTPTPTPPAGEIILLDTLTQFTGSNFIDLGQQPNIKSQTTGAIKAWIKITNNGVIMSSCRTVEGVPYLMLMSQLIYSYDLTYDDIIVSGALSNNQWHQMVWQVENGQWCVYVDSVKQTLSNARGSNHGFWWNHYNTDNFALGVLYRTGELSGGNYAYFTGWMASVSSFSSPLTQSQINTDFVNMGNAGLP